MVVRSVRLFLLSHCNFNDAQDSTRSAGTGRVLAQWAVDGSYHDGGIMADREVIDARVFVFDAYGTLFDVNSAARQLQDVLGEKWQALAETWRTKQLQYTWLRSLMARYVDFWQVTGDALDFAMATVKLNDAALREQLMKLYLRLSAYTEVPDVLAELKTRGKKLAILSNGAPKMLAAAAQNAGIDRLLDAILSVEEVGIYKPHPSVYRMVIERFNLSPTRVCFVSSNAWDAHAAKAFGFNVAWCNRFGQQRERIPGLPDVEITSLSELLPLLVPA